MKIFTIIIWILLGVFFFFFWDMQQDKCCTDQELKNGQPPPTQNEQSAITEDSDTKIIGVTDSLEKPTDSADSIKLIESSNPTEPDAETGTYFESFTLNFPYNSTRLNLEVQAQKKVDQLVEFVNKNPGKRVSITGHSDNIGGNNVNKKVGQWRADRMKDLLIGKGISDNRIIASSKGEDFPIADNGSPEGRAQNRRIEITILK